MIKLKVISVKKHFKNGNYRIIAKNLYTKTIRYFIILPSQKKRKRTSTYINMMEYLKK